jgi:hypothetical protein
MLYHWNVFSLHIYIYIYIFTLLIFINFLVCRRFSSRLGDFFKIYLILLAALGPGVYSASNRNEYEKHKSNNVSGE